MLEGFNINHSFLKCDILLVPNTMACKKRAQENSTYVNGYMFMVVTIGRNITSTSNP